MDWGKEVFIEGILLAEMALHTVGILPKEAPSVCARRDGCALKLMTRVLRECYINGI